MQEIARDENSVTYKDGNCTIKFMIGHLDNTPEGKREAKDKMFKEATEVYQRNADHIIKKYNERLKQN